MIFCTSFSQVQPHYIAKHIALFGDKSSLAATGNDLVDELHGGQPTVIRLHADTRQLHFQGPYGFDFNAVCPRPTKCPIRCRPLQPYAPGAPGAH
ncbi:hypothetical protein WJX72_005756 [[Myrmecia] bisecta]|uniref:Uncharacterized protein n=1 Tax=[Myrmecia] bisecta TaxID=41462 RepID=A0AAW1PDM9_9CHLO